MKANQAACEVGQLALDMAQGYAAHIAAIRLAPRVDSNALVRLIAAYPLDSVQRKDGTEFTFDTQDALVSAVANGAIAAELPRVWFAGSLLAVGDALQDNGCFDHAPELELIYHLRNGIAHGNRFKFTDPGRQRLSKHPAHNRACFKNTIFEITPALDGQRVLFDFLGAGDVLDLLCSVGLHLNRIGDENEQRRQAHR